MPKLAAALLILTILAAISVGVASGNAEMMAKCQEKHSYARCYELIHN